MRADILEDESAARVIALRWGREQAMVEHCIVLRTPRNGERGAASQLEMELRTAREATSARKLSDDQPICSQCRQSGWSGDKGT
jgi:hypothetical protein